MEDDLNGLDVGCEDDEFTDTSVESFGGFVSSTGWSAETYDRRLEPTKCLGIPRDGDCDGIE